MGRPGMVYMLCGDGKGKTSAAIGRGIKAAGSGQSVVIIQFLKGKDMEEYEILRSFEPDIKIFSFEKTEQTFKELTQKQKIDEIENVRTGMNFAKKVLTAGECDLLILDEFLGLVDTGIITLDEFKDVINARPEDTSIIMTGINISEAVKALADEVTVFKTEFPKQ